MKLQKLVAPIAVAAMLGMLATTASAGILLPLDSELKVNLGALPPITVDGSYQHGGWATVSGTPVSGLTDTPDIWKDAGVSVGTSLLTGVALISALTLTAENDSGSFGSGYTAANPWGGNLTGTLSQTNYSGTICAGGCLGGLEGLTGQFVVTILGSALPFPLSVVGIGGTAALPVGQGAIVATGGPFITGKARITNITTNVISLPTRGTAGVTGIGITLEPNGTEEVKTFTTGNGFITDNPTGVLETQATVTLAGTNTLAGASGTGNISLVSPLRIQTGPLGVGNIPGKFTKTFVFVPEPGTVLLLVSGAAGLVILGRKRMKS